MPRHAVYKADNIAVAAEIRAQEQRFYRRVAAITGEKRRSSAPKTVNALFHVADHEPFAGDVIFIVGKRGRFCQRSKNQVLQLVDVLIFVDIDLVIIGGGGSCQLGNAAIGVV